MNLNNNGKRSKIIIIKKKIIYKTFTFVYLLIARLHEVEILSRCVYASTITVSCCSKRFAHNGVGGSR